MHRYNHLWEWTSGIFSMPVHRSAKNPLIRISQMWNAVSLGVDIQRRDNINCLSFVVSTVHTTALEVGRQPASH